MLSVCLDTSQKQAKVSKKKVETIIYKLLEMHGKGSIKCGWSVEVMNVMCGCQLKHHMDGVVNIMSSGVLCVCYRK